jgi:hypothetical protein
MATARAVSGYRDARESVIAEAVAGANGILLFEAVHPHDVARANP